MKVTIANIVEALTSARLIAEPKRVDGTTSTNNTNAATKAATDTASENVITGFEIDSRRVIAGEAFVAITGPNFDGHTFVANSPASIAIVQRELTAEECNGKPHIVVPDTRIALGELGRIWRRQFKGKVVALTGSNGKTSTKEMLFSILQQAGSATATVGNLNNDYGVPLTLSKLQPDHDFAVIEMGANHAGEIDYLASLAEPDVVMVTNAGAAHLEGFGSLDGVATAKGEIYTALDRYCAPQAVAVINANDHYAELWQQMVGQHVALTFGMHAASSDDSSRADSSDKTLQSEKFTADFSVDLDTVTVSNMVTHFTMKTIAGDIDVALPRLGNHNIANALAAAAAAAAAGASLQNIQDGLNTAPTVQGRLALQDGPYNSQIIDDSYNANPASVKAGIDVLVGLAASLTTSSATSPANTSNVADTPHETSGALKPWLVLGDMSEIGPESAQAHADLGTYALQAGVTRLWAWGLDSTHTAKAFGSDAKHFATHEALANDLLEALAQQQADDAENHAVVLVKGSRSSSMENVIAMLMETKEAKTKNNDKNADGMAVMQNKEST